ncbi:MAG: sulfatase-like hydrolase/transferase [Pirellulaceae bacterium]|nr:sulfatase-like hydrolase/transferase [Pirellulaceae bacterium]
MKPALRFCLIALTLGLVSTTSAAQPNVILIMTDDQGYGDLSCHGNPTLQTPHLDALHAESIRLTDFHVSPYCTPTRAALMTGRYPARTGAYRTSSGRTSLHGREKTLGDLFTLGGYATGMFGKWHLGDCAPSRPMDCGFERSVWHRCGGLTQISDFWTNDYFDDTYLVGDQWKPFKGYCTDVWFDESMKFISSVITDAGGNKPFFVYLAPNAPHGPYLVADKWKKPFLDQGIPKTQAAFKGMVANFDWNLGRLVEFLDKEKLSDNTVVIFLTDNGTAAGAIFGKGGRIYGWPVDPRENGHRRGGKSSAYDGGHRVPCFIRWPSGSIGPPRDIDTLLAHLDLTPTLIDLCELKRPADWPTLDGASFASLLRNTGESWQPRTLHSQMHGGNGYTKPGDPWEIGVAMTQRWRLVEGRELYDIIADPEQKQDLATQFPDVVKDLDQQHRAWHQALLPTMVPTRILLGSDLENPSSLTSQEWVMPRGSPPWAHQHVVKRQIANAPWWIDIAKAGRYRFTLSRWPLSIQKPIDSTAAKISIFDQIEQVTIDDPDQVNSIDFELNLPGGPTQLQTWLTTPEGKTHGAYFVTVQRITATATRPAILWTQYCRSGNTVKLSVHTDSDPLHPSSSQIQLEVEREGAWQPIAEAPIGMLTAMAEFRIEALDPAKDLKYRVRSGESSLDGVIRHEPADIDTLKLMAVACVNDKWFPYDKAIAQMIEQNPDLVFFAGDQIYESNAGGQVADAATEADVPMAMANYLAKWRRFGLTFRDLLKDRPSIMITDDHDVYANDLWGDGGRRMTGDRTTGGYNMHPQWVNAVERTQTWHLPDAANPGPWGDGVRAYYTDLDYASVSFAILEDRKFKSPPSAVLSKAIVDPQQPDQPNRTLEVIKDPAFDTATLDRDDLNLLGAEQESFLRDWASKVVQNDNLAAVLSQSPFVNIGNYDVRYGDMDANGWPQSARNRALRTIAPTQAIMISGDIHFGTLHQHGIDQWGDGPWSYSLPAFSSKPNRNWGPSAAPQGGAIAGIAGSGNHVDRFGNRITVAGTAPGVSGYGLVVFDKRNRRITCQLHTLDEQRDPAPRVVAPWPFTIEIPSAN